MEKIADAKMRVAVLGLGASGGRTIRALQATPLARQLDLAAADTDESDLRQVAAVQTIVLGQGLGYGGGCGGELIQGERAAAASAAALRQFIDGAKLLLVCTGLGGGTGTGAVVNLARQARNLEVPAFFLLTLPFSFEGDWRTVQAESVLEPLRELADAVIVVPNDILFATFAADLGAPEAFRVADGLLAEALCGLASMVWADRLLAADFAAIRALLRRQRGSCRLGIGRGNGANRLVEAVDSFLDCPMLGGRESLAGVSTAVVNLQANCDLSISEVNNCLSTLQRHFPPLARVSVGVCRVDAGLAEIQLTGILCRGGDPESHLGSEMADLPSRLEPPRPVAAPAVAAGAGKFVQGELPLQKFTLGIFPDGSPTRYRNENLDIPTYQRRNVQLDLGD